MHHSLVPQSDTIRLPDFKSNTTFKASKKLYSLMLVFDAWFLNSNMQCNESTDVKQSTK